MGSYLKPHTPEWFQALESVNPMQATQTRQLIASAGRDDICTTCGDEVSAEYRIAGEEAAQSPVSTLRLCGDCVKIRSDLYGERFVAL